MACFTVPVAEAVVTTIITKRVKKNEQESKKSTTAIRFSEKLGWLNKMLWGGSGLLAFEHLWHGEITPWPPFLTGAENPSEMFAEMATNGVGMAALVTLVWAGMVAVTSKLSKSTGEETAEVTP